MRIIGGTHRGRKLTSLCKGDTAAHLRPTTDRVRESLFNVLMGGYGDPVRGARVLDIFAGTGALGLEALSRGAVSVSFVENGRKAQVILSENIALLRAEPQTNVFRNDARRLTLCRTAPFDLIFLDPPYGKGLGGEALSAAMKQGWLAEDALVVWEENTVLEVPNGLRIIEARPYGGTVISFLERG